MNQASNDRPILLEQLDGHLRALLKTKLREFIYLNSWFNDPRPAQKNLLEKIVKTPKQNEVSTSIPWNILTTNCPHQKRKTMSSSHRSPRGKNRSPFFNQ